MCTVTFVARKGGYYLGMNRDEKLTRAPGLSPQIYKLQGCNVLCPSEPGGGTWIATNDRSVTLGLINWYRIPPHRDGNAISRGEVVNSANTSDSSKSVNAAVTGLPLKRINPFRLIGIFLTTHEVVEWRWDLKSLVRKNHPWKTQQWISSGFNEPTAQVMRGRNFVKAQSQRSTGSLSWLRRLHRSHKPHAGPFSTCMHRNDAATVSYTEVSGTSQQTTMRYHAGSPCQHFNLRQSQIVICRYNLKSAPRQNIHPA